MLDIPSLASICSVRAIIWTSSGTEHCSGYCGNDADGRRHNIQYTNALLVVCSSCSFYRTGDCLQKRVLRDRADAPGSWCRAGYAVLLLNKTLVVMYHTGTRHGTSCQEHQHVVAHALSYAAIAGTVKRTENTATSSAFSVFECYASTISIVAAIPEQCSVS